MVSIRGYLELTRPVNAVAAGLLTAIGAFVASGLDIRPLPVAAAIGATIAATAGGNAVNDYFDREIDRVNRPDRPIPRGAVPPRGAIVFATVLFVVAAGLAAVLPRLALAIAVVNLLALVVYTELLKGLPGVGNLVVACLGGSTFVFGAAAVGRPAVAVPLSALAALATLAREIVKDVEDIEGDREEGLRTLPIAVGPRRSLWLATALLLGAVIASPVPYLLGTFGLPYLVVVVPADVLLVVAAVTSFSDPTAGQRRLKYGTFLAAGAFVVGRLTAVGL